MLANILRWVAFGLGAAWLFCLAIFAIGVFGLFGQERDPMSGVYVMLLGLPWSRMLDMLPESLWTIALTIAPGLNVLIVWLLAYLANRLGGRPKTAG